MCSFYPDPIRARVTAKLKSAINPCYFVLCTAVRSTLPLPRVEFLIKNGHFNGNGERKLFHRQQNWGSRFSRMAFVILLPLAEDLYHQATKPACFCDTLTDLANFHPPIP